MGDAPQVNLVKLREILLERAVSDDLRIFCADLRVNYEEIVGPNDKFPIAIDNIVKYFNSRGRIDELITRARREFPAAPWMELFTLPASLPEVKAQLRPVIAEHGCARLIQALQARAKSLREIQIRVPKETAPPSTEQSLVTDPLLIEISKRSFRLEFVSVPEGEFLVGSDPMQEEHVASEERPQHLVYLNEYYIGKYPITVEQFSAFVKATGYMTVAEQQGYAYILPTGHTWAGNIGAQVQGAYWQRPRGRIADVSQKQNHPVTCVSWDDTMAFCKWLSQETNLDIQLPAEAQWEKAARGTDGRIYPWGNELPDETRCNFNMNAGDTTPVGKYSPRGDGPYDCADMAGNVWEWTRSLWSKKFPKPEFKYPYTEKTKQRENVDARRDYLRVLRGGSFHYDQRNMRCAARGRSAPYRCYDNHGFRVCAFPRPPQTSVPRLSATLNTRKRV